jgi:hypothetical protein
MDGAFKDFEHLQLGIGRLQDVEAFEERKELLH